MLDNFETATTDEAKARYGGNVSVVANPKAEAGKNSSTNVLKFTSPNTSGLTVGQADVSIGTFPAGLDLTNYDTLQFKLYRTKDNQYYPRVGFTLTVAPSPTGFSWVAPLPNPVQAASWEVVKYPFPATLNITNAAAIRMFLLNSSGTAGTGTPCDDAAYDKTVWIDDVELIKR
jgi:hypothetical protein